MKLIPPWLRRRAWLLVATIGLVVAAGTALGWNRGSVYHGQALFIVPSGATTQGPGGAYEAKTLAITYVNLIPEDEAIVRYVALK